MSCMALATTVFSSHCVPHGISKDLTQGIVVGTQSYIEPLEKFPYSYKNELHLFSHDIDSATFPPPPPYSPLPPAVLDISECLLNYSLWA